MRLLATRTSEWRFREAITRLMLVTTPDDEWYPGSAVVYAYDIEGDGPSSTSWRYEAAEHATTDLEQEWGIPRTCWRTVPDQLTGCQLDWIAPVRVKRSPGGTPVDGKWERWADGRWIEVAVDGPQETGG